MTALSPSVALGRLESPICFLSRLAARNGVRTRQLCSDLKLPFQRIADGEQAALNQLADIAGAKTKAGKLAENAIIRVGEREYRFRDERLLKTSVRRFSFRVCPMCLQEDLSASPDPAPYAPYVRVIWQIEALRTCKRHGVALIEPAWPDDPEERIEFPRMLATVTPDLDRLSATAIRRKPSALEAYLLGRVGLAPPTETSNPWLDGLEWHVVAKMAEVLGVVELYGRRQGLKHLTEEQRYAASVRGFDHLRAGRDGLRMFLQGLYDNYPRTGNTGPQAVLGDPLNGFLARGAPDAAYDPIRDVAREFAEANFDLADGEMVFGAPVRRRFYTLHSASASLGMHPLRLRKILNGAGVLPMGRRASEYDLTLMPADAVTEIVEIERSSLDLTELEAVLGVGRPHPKHLRQAGLITPIAWSATAVQRGQKYAKAEINGFLTRLYKRATLVSSAPAGTLDPVAAARNACSPLVDVLKLVLDGALESLWRVADGVGVAALRLDPTEVRRSLCGSAPDGLAPSWVEKRLSTSNRVMQALIKLEVFTPVTIVNPVHGGVSKLIPMVEILDFERRYVSLTHLAAEQGRHFSAVLADLDAKGIRPVWKRTVVRSRWYRRSDTN